MIIFINAEILKLKGEILKFLIWTAEAEGGKGKIKGEEKGGTYWTAIKLWRTQQFNHFQNGRVETQINIAYYSKKDRARCSIEFS